MTTYTADAAILTAADAADTDLFGISVDLNADGAVLAVGAELWEGAYSAQGGVYIYDRVADAWVQRGAVLTPADAAVNYKFGAAVGLNATGNMLVVGSTGHGGDPGGVYVFDRSGSTWTQRGAVIKPPAPATADNKIGYAVTLNDAGTVLALGAPGRNGTYTAQGCVYIYDWSGSAWVLRGSALFDSPGAASATFGYAVDLNSAGDILVVGAPYATGTISGQGIVYIYDWSGSAWVKRGGYLAPADAAASDRFGFGVAIAGAASDKLAVGAPYREGVSPVYDTGAVYLFTWSGSAWIQDDVLAAADQANVDNFGTSAAMSTDALMVSAGALYWEGTANNQGAVYTFTAPAPEPPAEPEPVVSAHRYLLTAYVSGAENSTTDYAVPLATLGLSKRSAAMSYYAITAPFSADRLDAILARPDGIIHLLRDGVAWETFNQGFPVGYDIGPMSSSITLNGTRQETIADAAVIDLEPRMVLGESVNSSGLLVLDVVPGFFDIRPTDIVTWDGADYAVTLVKFQANANSQTLNITAELV